MRQPPGALESESSLPLLSHFFQDTKVSRVQCTVRIDRRRPDVLEFNSDVTGIHDLEQRAASAPVRQPEERLWALAEMSGECRNLSVASDLARY
jgi:hypothetical protein